MASYLEIKNYVLEKHGHRVKSGWIAHAKEEYGIPIKSAWNRKGEERLWKCPKKHLDRFKEVFIHFELIENNSELKSSLNKIFVEDIVKKT